MQLKNACGVKITDSLLQSIFYCHCFPAIRYGTNNVFGFYDLVY